MIALTFTLLLIAFAYLLGKFIKTLRFPPDNWDGWDEDDWRP